MTNSYEVLNMYLSAQEVQTWCSTRYAMLRHSSLSSFRDYDFRKRRTEVGTMNTNPRLRSRHYVKTLLTKLVPRPITTYALVIENWCIEPVSTECFYTLNWLPVHTSNWMSNRAHSFEAVAFLSLNRRK